MPTISKLRRLEEAADLYVRFGILTQKLCGVIKEMHPKVECPEEWTQEQKDFVINLINQQDAIIKGILMPYVKALEELDGKIRENLPNQSRIIRPDEIQ